MDYQLRCRIDQIKRHRSTNRRVFEKKKFQYESKSEGVLPVVPPPPPPSAPIADERSIPTPQGSMISEQEKKGGTIDDEDQMIRDEMNDLHLDSDQVRIVQIFFFSMVKNYQSIDASSRMYLNKEIIRIITCQERLFIGLIISEKQTNRTDEKLDKK